LHDRPEYAYADGTRAYGTAGDCWAGTFSSSVCSCRQPGGGGTTRHREAAV